MKQFFITKSVQRYFFLLALITFSIYAYQKFDINFINDLFENSIINLNSAGLYSGLLIFVLRSFSIIIPIIPGTYCAIIAGYLFGIQYGLILIFIADFISCSSSFLIARRLGRGYVKKLLGTKQMQQIEKISQQYLEHNFFLMTGFLMTSWFDFVCYAVGLTKLSWKKFMPALILSILVSDLPFVAGGYTISGFKDVSILQVLRGEVKVLDGPYLIILITSVLVIFGIGLLNIFIKKKSKLFD